MAIAGSGASSPSAARVAVVVEEPANAVEESKASGVEKEAVAVSESAPAPTIASPPQTEEPRPEPLPLLAPALQTAVDELLFTVYGDAAKVGRTLDRCLLNDSVAKGCLVARHSKYVVAI